MHQYCFTYSQLIYFRTTYTRSIGLSRFMTATEKVRYTPHPEHPNETIAMKEIWIESGLYGLRYVHNIRY